MPTLAGWGHPGVRPVSSSARNPATVYDTLLSECGDPSSYSGGLNLVYPPVAYPAIPVYNGAGGAGCAQPVYVPAVPGFAPALPVHSPARAPLATDPSSSTITGDEASAWLDASLPDDRPCFASGILLHMAPGSPSGYRGVTFDKARNRYKAQVSIAGRRKSICTASTAVEAAMHFAQCVLEMQRQRCVPVPAEPVAPSFTLPAGFRLVLHHDPCLPTGYTGVSNSGRKLPYRARYYLDLGYFPTALDAAVAYAIWHQSLNSTNGSDHTVPPAIHWWSRLQRTVTHLSAEAEYIATSLAACEAAHVRALCPDLRVDLQGPTPLRLDSKSAIDMAHDPVAFKKTKHIMRESHYLHDLVARRIYLPQHVPSAEQLADILTKAMPRVPFARLRDTLLSSPR